MTPTDWYALLAASKRSGSPLNGRVAQVWLAALGSAEGPCGRAAAGPGQEAGVAAPRPRHHVARSAPRRGAGGADGPISCHILYYTILYYMILCYSLV